MEEIFIISAAAFLTALLTFFSGFGLGTILAPVFVIFFPVEVAIALTAVVHFANNLFKGALVGRNANWGVLLKFGLPAFAASFAGAWLLIRVAGLKPIWQYTLWGGSFEITPVKLMVAVLLIFFSLFEILPAAQRLQASRNKMIFGGLLSGFFGGLSGMQGAIRSAFLIRSGLNKEAYIGTGVIIACLVDISRLAVYATHFAAINLQENLPLLISACLSAFTGAFIGRKVLKKVTFRSIQILVGIMLIVISIALGAGLI
ncbi:MAG TPA: sulfite exporter TauE/SafE family protein [Bacteroidales bacterium]|nr:sulfite exporter TauE/SafE family protein [Bacteroidales bacterium]